MASEIFSGLSEEEVISSRGKFGTNIESIKKQNKYWKTIKLIITEPVFIILVCTAFIYFILGEYKESIIMIAALVFVSGISLYQENKSRNATESLRKLASPKAKVIRSGQTITIESEDIVMNDLIVVEDGNIIPADAVVKECHDFSVNESILTGESLPVMKETHEPNNIVYQGTVVMSGSCIAGVTAIGSKTELGKIGRSMQEIEVTKTPLQKQINDFVRQLVIAGVFAFITVWVINYYISKDILQSLLHGLTLAMSVLPEEIPVAFSTFMALGAYHLYKKKVIVRNPQAIETLGAATVICTDKTGTLTENDMELSALYDFSLDKIYDFTEEPYSFSPVLEFAMWASERDPFDTMEKSIHKVYEEVAEIDKRPSYSFIHEYPLGGIPPIMTHVYVNENREQVISCKGSIEGITNQSGLTPTQKRKIDEVNNLFAQKGFRVLAVASSTRELNDLPDSQQEFDFDFLGLIAFYDPPKKNIKHILNQFYEAGIKVKMITGDYSETALAIARQIDLRCNSEIINGKEVMEMDEQLLRKKVNKTNIYARMFPDAKLKVIDALKANGEIVAMTGDGVNDGPALKAAHIGIAMGKRGSELAKNAASLILINDDLSGMIDAIANGRRIYENLKKAIRYIISIHIPIISIVTIPLLLFWKFTDFFSPIHVIFLELIMGPTCSIVFENEPIEDDSMLRKPRKINASFFSIKELSLSILQGIAITIACLGLGYFYMNNNYSESEVRTVIYVTLIFSNLFLTLVNRSFHYSILTTIRYRNRLIPIVLVISLIVLFLSVYYVPLQEIFQFKELQVKDILLCLASAFIGIIWVELYKSVKRKKIS
jgi:P-type Ca2+ transporter type 2C